MRTSGSRRAAADVQGGQVIELRLVAQDAEDDFGGEAGIAGVEGARAGGQQVGGVAAGFDRAEDVEGDAGRDTLHCQGRFWRCEATDARWRGAGEGETSPLRGDRRRAKRDEHNPGPWPSPADCAAT